MRSRGIVTGIFTPLLFSAAFPSHLFCSRLSPPFYRYFPFLFRLYDSPPSPHPPKKSKQKTN